MLGRKRRASHFRAGAGMPELIEKWGRGPFMKTCAVASATTVGLAASGNIVAAAVLGVPTALFAVRGVLDIKQERRTILRNFPVLGHIRYIFESIRPEIRQYFVESDQESTPFTREQRALVYQRSKSDVDSNPFGTRRDVRAEGYEWALHSMYPAAKIALEDARITFGTEASDVKKPYNASIYNVSAMSFGAISSAAVLALNGGAKLGGFYHNTGEGGISRHHIAGGGDIVWNIGSGYFGCRDPATGKFSPERFAENAARDQVRMIEIKLSQGAKPGHGGLLPGSKVTAAIAEARGVQIGQTCDSPSRHSAFDSPETLLEFAAKLRELSGGKPVGIKMCVGNPVELARVVRASERLGMYFDFITVDGGEGGTGAAPAEYTNHIGTPLSEGLYLVHNMLVGAGIRDKTRVIASGKIISGFSLFRAMTLGADTANAARGFMFSLGCIQSLKCHTNMCPTGIATQDEELIQGLSVTDKRVRVYNFQKKTVEAALDITASCGFSAVTDVRSRPVLMVRTSPNTAVFMQELYPRLKPGELVGITKEMSSKTTIHSDAKERLIRAWAISGGANREMHDH
eukprot:PhM_4_TR6240/c0_g1_i1/m.86682